MQVINTEDLVKITQLVLKDKGIHSTLVDGAEAINKITLDSIGLVIETLITKGCLLKIFLNKDGCDELGIPYVLESDKIKDARNFLDIDNTRARGYEFDLRNGKLHLDISINRVGGWRSIDTSLITGIYLSSEDSLIPIEVVVNNVLGLIQGKIELGEGESPTIPKETNGNVVKVDFGKKN